MLPKLKGGGDRILPAKRDMGKNDDLDVEVYKKVGGVKIIVKGFPATDKNGFGATPNPNRSDQS